MTPPPTPRPQRSLCPLLSIGSRPPNQGGGTPRCEPDGDLSLVTGMLRTRFSPCCSVLCLLCRNVCAGSLPNLGLIILLLLLLSTVNVLHTFYKNPLGDICLPQTVSAFVGFLFIWFIVSFLYRSFPVGCSPTWLFLLLLLVIRFPNVKNKYIHKPFHSPRDFTFLLSFFVYFFFSRFQPVSLHASCPKTTCCIISPVLFPYR